MKKPEKNLPSELVVLRAVFETVVEGVVTFDSQGTVLSANPAAARVFGCDRGGLVGRRLWDLIIASDDDNQAELLGRGTIVDDRKSASEWTKVKGRRADGSVVTLDYAVRESRIGSESMFTATLHDAAAQEKAAEVEIESQVTQRANTAKAEFVSRMSHELRTPLNVMLGFAQIMEISSDSPELQDSSRSILAAGNQLLNLINELLDLSQIDSGLLKLTPEPVELSNVLLLANENVRALAQSAGVRVKIHVESARDVYVSADSQRLLQVFINLISNAIKFNRPKGSVDVKCEVGSGNIVNVQIKDTGLGITPEQSSRLFHPFERFGDRYEEGTGLGLALSRSFVELMHGTLTMLESSPKGTIFCVGLHSAESMTTNLFNGDQNAKPE